MLRGIKSALEQEHAAWESIKLQKQRKLEEENKAAVGYLRRMHEQKNAAIRSELHAIAAAQLETCSETAAEIVQARADLLKTNRLMTNLELLQTIATR